MLLSDGTPKMKEVGATCPKLKQKGHSTWYFYFELESGENGKRRRIRRGGFKTQDDAKVAAKKELKKAEGGTDILSSATVGDDLTAWVERKGSLARTTSHGYEGHIRLYLMPHLGHIKRKDLHARHIEAMYAAIKKENAERLLHHGRVVELAEARDAAKEAWIRASGKGEERRQARSAYLDANAALRKGRRGLRKITGPADAPPHQRHPELVPEQRDQAARIPDQLGVAHRAASRQAAEAAGVDARARRALAAHGREARPGDGLDARASRGLPGLRGGRPPLRPVGHVHLPRPAPRRNGSPPLDGGQPHRLVHADLSPAR